MPTAQTGLFDESTLFHYHLEYRLTGSRDIIHKVVSIVNNAAATLDGKGYILLGVRPSIWSSLFPSEISDELQDFESIHGVKNFVAPSTQNDLWFWIHSQNHDKNLDAALSIQEQLKESAQLVVDIPSFVRHEKRDLTGFIDGTANPKDEARQEAALIPQGNTGEGGSIAFTQRWVHNLAAFHRLNVSEQEKIIGRTKPDSIELEGDDMPENSHVSRTDVKIDGTALKIYRRSTPYGTTREHGLFFVAFSCERRRIQIQLERMYGVWSDQIHDRIVEFSQAVTGSYWFVPSASDLSNLTAN